MRAFAASTAWRVQTGKSGVTGRVHGRGDRSGTCPVGIDSIAPVAIRAIHPHAG